MRVTLYEIVSFLEEILYSLFLVVKVKIPFISSSHVHLDGIFVFLKFE